MGTEVEYGVTVQGQPMANHMVASSQVVNAYASATVKARRARWDFEEESPLRDARGFDMSRQVADPSQLTDEDMGLANVILTNGARLYVDHAHPEYSTPEVTTPLDIVRWDKAGELVMLDAARMAAQVPGTQPIHLYKNNTDNKGASYGAHENYLMRRSTPFGDIVRHLTPFFVSRQVVCGSGRVGIGQDGREHGYQISQRADYFEVEVGLETTLKRPIINTRDEPHADPEKYRRLHVIIGDANLAEVSTYLKVGTTSLVLAMIEDRFITRDLGVDSPVASLRAVSHDPSLQHLLTMDDGRKLTAVQLQLEYLDLARKYVEDKFGDDADAQTKDVLARWESVLARLESDPMQCAEELDWVAKLALLEQYRDARRPRLEQRQAAADRLPVLRHPAREGPLPPPARARAGSSGCSTTPRSSARCTTRPRTPAPTSVAGAWRSTPTRRRRVVGLGDLRPAGPRVPAAGAHHRPPARHQGARRRADRPLRHRPRRFVRRRSPADR